MPRSGSCGNCRAVERVGEIQKQFPHPFHRAWKTLRPQRYEFPTVPTVSAAGFIALFEAKGDQELWQSLSRK